MRAAGFLARGMARGANYHECPWTIRTGVNRVRPSFPISAIRGISQKGSGYLPRSVSTIPIHTLGVEAALGECGKVLPQFLHCIGLQGFPRLQGRS
jgi:hypothetical protein